MITHGSASHLPNWLVRVKEFGAPPIYAKRPTEQSELIFPTAASLPNMRPVLHTYWSSVSLLALSPFSSSLYHFEFFPDAFCSTVNSEALFTTSFPDRSMWTAGLSGSAFFLTVFPRFVLIAISPSLFVSATVPSGEPLPHFHDTIEGSSC